MSFFKSVLGAATGIAGGGVPAGGPSSAKGGDVKASTGSTFGGIAPVAIGGFKSDGSAIIAQPQTWIKYAAIAVGIFAVGWLISRKR